jgi:hypothetical protein
MRPPVPADVRRLVLALVAACAVAGCGSFPLVPPTPPPQIADGFIRGGLRFVTPAELGPGIITAEQALAVAGAGPARADRELPLLGVYAGRMTVRGGREERAVWVVVYGWSTGEVFEVALVDARSGRLFVEPPAINR